MASGITYDKPKENIIIELEQCSELYDTIVEYCGQRLSEINNYLNISNINIEAKTIDIMKYKENPIVELVYQMRNAQSTIEEYIKNQDSPQNNNEKTKNSRVNQQNAETKPKEGIRQNNINKNDSTTEEENENINEDETNPNDTSQNDSAPEKHDRELIPKEGETRQDTVAQEINNQESQEINPNDTSQNDSAPAPTQTRGIAGVVYSNQETKDIPTIKEKASTNVTAEAPTQKRGIAGVIYSNQETVDIPTIEDKK